MDNIYCIKSDQYYKIGMTVDVNARLMDLQVLTPHKLTIIHSFETDYPHKAEKFLHKIFANKRVSGEWFNLSITDINFIQSICGFHNDSFIWSNNPILPIDKVEAGKPNKIYEIEGCHEPTKVTERQVLDFAQGIWRRQVNGERALSRNYWCKNRKPKLSYPVYEAMIKLLEQTGAIINRGQGKQGQMIVSPGEILSLLQNLD